MHNLVAMAIWRKGCVNPCIIITIIININLGTRSVGPHVKFATYNLIVAVSMTVD
jgi:hypothetical protein